jgi:hypothetical protein
MCYTPGMARLLRAASIACLLLSTATVAHAQLRSPWDLTRRDEDLAISLVTFGPGDAVHQYFGHNALLVEDRARGAGALYNFGMFSFGPDMLPKYLRGQLEFWAAATPVEPTYDHYRAENRSIHVRELNLSPTRRRALADRLAKAVLPANRSYLYHHYANNCSTKLRDLINDATSGQLERANSNTGRFTYRGDTRRYTQHDPIVHMLLLLWMNDSMERPIRRYDEAFLPGELERMVAGTQYVDEHGAKVHLSRLAYTVFEARRAPVPEAPSAAWPGLLAVGVAIGGLALVLARWLRATASRIARILLGLQHALVGLVVGLPGLVAFLLLFTQWDVTHYNENLLLANPLTFAALPLGLFVAGGSKRALRWVGMTWIALGASTVLLMLLKALPAFDQDTSLPMTLLAPINIGCALAHLGLLRHRRGAIAGHAARRAPSAATS